MVDKDIAVDWTPFIESNPEVLVGKPVVTGTRLAVDFLLSLRSVGWTDQQLLDNYPNLTAEALRAVYAFAAECVGDETIFPLPLSRAR